VQPIVFQGQYEDASGVEPVEWRIVSSTRAGWDRRFEVHASIRGVHVWGADFDGLDAAESADAGSRLSLNQADEVSNCLLSGELPCTVSVSGALRPSTIHFVLDLRPQENPDPYHENLRLACEIDGTTYAVSDSWFEDGLLRLERTFLPDHQLVACVTCLYSDYSPGGHGLTGMHCHRDAKTQYLAVRSKADYWSVPVTEDVPETYLCDEYARRVPGTGYRG
jgi:Family of unknown function (DUF6304)